MSNIKITQLTEQTLLSANTSNTIFVGVDLPSGITSKFSATTIAKGLFAHNPLNVGNNTILFPNTIAQFAGSSDSYLQINLQNTDGNGSADIIITANNGTDTTNYIDLGINGSTFSSTSYSSMYNDDGYLYTNGSPSNSSNLVLGTATTGDVVLVVNGTMSQNIVARFTTQGLKLNTQSYITFADGSTLSSNAWISANDTITLNSAKSYTDSANTKLKSYIDGQVLSVASYNNDVNALQNNNIISANTQLKAYTDGAISSANTQLKAYTDGAISSANTQLKSYVDGAIVSANTQLKSYVDGAIVSANTQLKSYVDGAISSANTQLKAYTDGKFLANTSGALFNGTLNIGDKFNVNGSVIFANTQFTATQAALTIAACPIGEVQLPSNDGYMLHISGKQNVSSRIVSDSYGANTYVVFAGRSARGTPTAPQALANSDIMMRISGNGYGSTQFAQFGSARIDFIASENWTDTARGSQIKLYNCNNGSNVITEIATFNANSVEFTGVVHPQKGFIYSPNVVSSNVTTYTIDVANNSLYKLSCNADIGITLSNFQSGKVIEVWLTNVSASQRVVTHGCSALNSTTNSTTFNIPATSSAYIKYFSIDGDLANTFVTINHA